LGSCPADTPDEEFCGLAGQAAKVALLVTGALHMRVFVMAM